MKIGVLGTLAALILMTSANAFSANAWKSNLTLQGLYNIPGDGMLLFFPGGTDPVCGPSGNIFTLTPGVNGLTANSASIAYATALTAFSLGKTVNILYDNSISPCAVQILWVNSQ